MNEIIIEYEFPNNLKGGYYKEKNLCECGVQGAESYPFFCKDNPDCYYKQLQRAKAELEQYKKSKQASYETMQTEWNNAVNELRDVKAENEKLKEEVKEIRTWEELKLSKYRKALEEIKIIANNLKEDTGRYNIYDLSDKINEVLK